MSGVDNICKLCGGMGSRVVFYPDAGLQFWECQGCGGSGVRSVHGPAVIKIGRGQSRFCFPIGESKVQSDGR